ncbi:MAG: TonB-dependent receptor [Moheibacter sp.]
MNKFLLFTFYFLLFTFSSAQETCKLRGEIRDSIGLPVFDASVSAFNSKNEGLAFTFTDTEGGFVLDLPCNDSYDIEVEHIDYESYSENITLDKSKSVKFKMKRGVISLHEAVVRAKQPITVKGDTIEYDADSFRTAADENLEDLLKKLPGIQVENGKVYYEGKEIKTIKVGNREVLGGNTKLLTKNLPADAIDKVQLNKKFKQNPFSNSLSDDEEAMLNIELKEDKKSLLFGNVTLGGDADKHTDAQSKLFYFSPKTDGTFITDYNTYGKEVFTYEDYFSFLGGMSELMEEGSSFSLRDNSNTIRLGTAQDASEMSALLSALHFGYEPNSKIYTNGFLLFNNNHLSYKSTQERINNENYYERDEQLNDQHLLSTMGRFRLDFTPDSQSQLKYRLSFNYLENEDEQLADPYVNEISTGSRNSLMEKSSFSLRQNLSYIRKIGRDHNLGIYLRHQMLNDTPDLSINSEGSSMVIGDVSFNNLFQTQEFDKNNLQVYGIYNHLLTNTSNLRLKIGSNFSWQNLKNSIYEGNSLITNDHFLTDSDFNYSELYADVTYTKKWGIFKFDVGAGVHNFSEKTNLLTESRSLKTTKILPHIDAEIKFNNAQALNLTYRQEYKLPNLVDLSDGYDVRNYYSVYRGFLGLTESLYHTANLNYGYFNSFTFLNFYVGGTYNRTVDNIQSSSLMTSPQMNTLINNPEQDQSLSGYFGINKRFTRHYSLGFNGNISYSDYFTRINIYDLDNNLISNLVNNTSLIQNYTLTHKFKIRKKVELDAGLNYLRNDFESLTKNEFTTWRPFGRLAWSITDKFLLQSDYSYRLQYDSEELINENQSLNASLRYNIAKSTYLTFLAGNILGNERIVNTRFDATQNRTIIDTREVLGRYFILQLRYKF